MMRMEIRESLFVKELTSIAADIVFAADFIYEIVFAARSAAEALSKKQ